MKKLLSLLLFLLCIFVNAQDAETINKMISSQSLDDLKTLSNKIVSTYEIKYTYFKTKEVKRDESEIYQILYYFPSSESIKDGIPTEEQKKLFVKVNFGQNYIGENKNLKIKGNLNFYFREVYGSYLDLIQFWMRTFYPTSSKEEILSNYKLQEYRVNKDVKFVLKKEGESWRIFSSY